MKKLLIVLIIIVALVVGGGIALLSSVNSLLVKAVNTYGPDLTQTSVHLDKADISLMNGKGTLQGLFIGNPQGFKGKYAFTADTINAALDISTLTDKVVVIDQIDIVAPKVLYERTLTSDNLQTLLRNIKNATGGPASGTAQKPAAQQQQDSTRVVIRQLLIRGGTVSLLLPGTSTPIDIPLPDIRLENLGDDQGSTTFADVAALVLQRLAGTISQTAAGKLGSPETILRATEKTVDGKLNEVRQHFNTFLGK